MVATVDDYAVARDLLAPIFDTIVAQGVTAAIRQTVEAIEPDEEVSEADLASRLELSKGAVAYRVARAVKDGWLNNLETRRGCKAQLVRGTPLPADETALPTVELLRQVFECSNRIREEETAPSAPSPGGNGADVEEGWV